MMAKKPHNQSMEMNEKNTAEHMRSMSSMLSFIQGISNPKLLLARRYRARKNFVGIGYSNKGAPLSNSKTEDEEEKAGREDKRMVCVKTLIEEDMLQKDPSKRISDIEIHQKRSHSGFGFIFKKKNKQSRKKSTAAVKFHTSNVQASKNLDNCEPCHCRSPSKRSFMLKLATLLSKKTVDDRRCSKKHKDLNTESGDKDEIIQTLLDETKEVMEAIGMLNYNKEVFVELLKDSSSFLSKYIRDGQDCQVDAVNEPESCRQVQRNEIFNEVIKKLEQNQKLRKQNASQVPDKIVILQPSPSTTDQNLSSWGNKMQEQNPSERTLSSFSSYFSSKVVKWRLRNAFRKNISKSYMMSMYNIVHGLPYRHLNLTDRCENLSLKNMGKDSCIAEDQSISMTTDEKNILHDDDTEQRNEMLEKRVENEVLVIMEKLSGTTASLLSGQEEDLLSPLLNEPTDDITAIEMNKYDPPCISRTSECESQALESESVLVCSQTPNGDVTSVVQGTVEEDGVAELKCVKEDNCLETISVLNSNMPEQISEIYEEEGSSMASPLESQISSSEELPFVSSPAALDIKQREYPNKLVDKTEQPSPVSVLEPFISEDISSTCSEQAELTVSSEEHGNSETTEVGDSSLSLDLISERWDCLKQLLDPSLTSKLDSSLYELLIDPKLLLDFIGEIILEIQEINFRANPQLLYIRQNKFIQEVCVGIYRQTQSGCPCRLDQLIGEDMNKNTWTDLCFEIEDTILKVGGRVLEDLVEETVRCYAKEF